MLYLVSTPIGNLSDISLRALETLHSVDVIASEDTRKTGRLLKHFEIETPQMAFHEHNELRAADKIVERLRSGQSVALVTDAGTPGIADPGFTLVRAVLRANEETAGADAAIEITTIPGPTGLISALVLSGLPLHSFIFRGFPPRKSGQRQNFLRVDEDSPHTLIFYESPYRLAAFLQDALDVLGDRPAAVANDLTKLYEAVDRGPLSALIPLYAGKKLKGEFVVVFAGKDAKTD